MTEPVPASPPAARPGWINTVALGALLLLTLKLGWDVHRVRDLGMDDEAHYLSVAANFGRKCWPPPDDCPLYVVWYRGLLTLGLAPTRVYFVGWAALMFGLAGGTYVLTRSLGARPVFALFAGWLLLVCQIRDVWPYPMHLATVWLLWGTALAIRARNGWATAAALGVTLLLAAYTRPEFAVAFALYAAGFTGVALYRFVAVRAERLTILAASAAVLAVVGGGYTLFGNPLGGNRSIYAFAAHYALLVCDERKLAVDPWNNYRQLYGEAFGEFDESDSIFRAAARNPAAFTRHVRRAARFLPARFAGLLKPQLDAGRGGTLILWCSLLGLLALGFGAHLLAALRRVRAGAVPWPARALFVTVLVPLSGATLIIFPRDHYLLPLACLVLALGVAGLGRLPGADWAGRSWRFGRAGVVTAALLLAAVTPNLAHPWAIQNYWIGRPPLPAEALEASRTVRALRKLPLADRDRPVVILESDFSRAFYAGLRYDRVAQTEKQEQFWDFVARRRIDIIVLNQRLLQDARFRQDPDFQAFLGEKDSRRFRIIEVPLSGARLAVRQGLLAESR